MEDQDPKTTSPGHENHEFCQKCGYPFPNPPPNARYREEHKDLCGKIEGYKLNESEAGNSALSDENHHSEQQTAGSNGKKPTKEDVGSSDSGISLGKEEHSEGVIKNTDKAVEVHETPGHGGILIVTPGYNRDDLDYSLLIEERNPLGGYQMEGHLMPSLAPEPGPAPEQGPAPEPAPVPEPAPAPVPAPAPEPAELGPILYNGVEVPREVVETSGASVFLLVIRKPLKASDVRHGKARFTMPKMKILESNFLSDEERGQIESDNLTVNVITVLGQYQVQMKLYKSGRSGHPTKVLTGKGWRLLVDSNNLKEGENVELWRAMADDGSDIVYVLHRS